MLNRILTKRRYILPIGVLVATIPLICFVLFIKFSMIADLERNSIQQRETYAVTASQILQNRLDAEIDFGKSITSRRSLQKAVASGNTAEFNYHLKDLVELSSSVERAYIAAANGAMLASYPPDTAIIGKDFSHRDWFKETTRTWKPYVSEFFLRAVKPQQYIFTITLPIKSPGGDNAAILVIEPKSDFIRKALDNVNTGGSGSIYVVDKKGYAVYHQQLTIDRLLDYSRIPVVAKVIRGLNGAEKSFNPNSGQEEVAAYHPIARSGWGVVTEQPLAEVLAPLNNVARGFYLFAGVIVLLAGFNAYKWAGLLSATQKTAQELGERTCELEGANDRLREQSDTLHAQSQELEMQSEELQGQNEELQAQGEELEMQAAELQEQNIALENMRSTLALYNEQLEQKVKERTVALSEEIMHHRRTEQERMESEGRYSSLIENIHLGISLIDENYRVVMANSSLGQIFHRPVNDVINKICFQEFEKKATVCPHCPGRVAMETGQTASAETEVVRDDGSRIVLRIMAFPVADPYGKNTRFIEVIQDITEQRQVAEKNKLLESQLQQSQKMEAIGTLAGGIAHDFNNMLTVIMGYGQLLLMNTKLDAPQKEQVEQIVAATEKASQLTSGLLAFSRKQILNPRITNLNEIVLHIQKLFARIIGEDIKLKMISNQADLKVKVDSGQIEQVLINLVTNARDAMKNGGLLTIETGFQEVDASIAQSSGLGKPGSYAVIMVSDNGVGMDEETRKRVFEPFFTTKEVGKGTGLGMAIVFGIVRQHDGFINVYSEPGKGTTFKVYIPLVESEEASAEKILIKEYPTGGNETILVAEDEDDVRELVEKVLTKFGYQVILAIDGQDAVEKFEANRDMIKLILMDMIMPRKSGKEAYNEIRRLQPSAKVLYSSGYALDFIRSRGELEEGTDLLMKPVQPIELLRKVREMLDA